MDATERVSAYKSMRRDKDALFVINGTDAAALVLACSTVPRVRVMALRLAATMAALQNCILGTVNENKAAVAAIENRRWVPEPSSDDTWGTAHVNLGTALEVAIFIEIGECLN